MKVKLLDLANSAGALHEVATQKIAASKAYELNKLFLAVDKELSPYNQVKDQKIKELGMTEQGMLKPEMVPQFMEDMKDIHDREIELPDVNVTVQDFAKCEIAPAVFSQLQWLIH